jgi:signal transduction histidine kinase
MRAAQGETAHADDLVIHFGGQDRVLEAWSVPIRDANGQVSAIITAFQEITARRAIDHELESYREHLEQRVRQRTAELATANATLYARIRELSALNDISQRVALITDLDRTLQEVAGVLCELYAVPNVSIALLDAEHGALRVAAMEERAGTSLLAFLGQLLPYNSANSIDPRKGPRVIQDIAQATALPPAMRAELRMHGVAQVLLAPLLSRDEELGLICIFTDDPLRIFSTDELHVAETVAGPVAAAIDTLALLHEARLQRDRAEALRKTTAALSRSLDQQNVLAAILEQLYFVFDYEGAAIALVEGDRLVIVDANGLAAPDVGRTIDLREPGASVKVLQDGAPLLIEETGNWPGWKSWNETEAIRCWLGVPLISGDNVIGVLNLASTVAGVYSQKDIDLLMAFAGQAAVAVTNARLYQHAQIAAAISERERIARDLHDAVTQTIFSANLIIDALPAQLPDASPAVSANLLLLSKLTKGALAELRTLLLELRPDNLTNTPLERLLSHLAEAFTGRMGTPVTMQANCAPNYVTPPPVQRAAYRIAQEALNNIAKHANAEHVSINLVVRPGQVRLAVFDDGCGFAVQQFSDRGLGLSIMRDRAADVGAQFWIDGTPGMGTQLFFVWEEASPELISASSSLLKGFTEA